MRKTRSPELAAFAVAVAVTAGATASCSSQMPQRSSVSSAATSSSSAPVVEPISGPVQSLDQVGSPLEEFQPTAAQLTRQQQRITDATNACLAARHQGSISVNAHELSGFADTLVADRRSRSDLWGFFDPRTVGEYGYHRPAGVPQTISVSFAARAQDVRSCTPARRPITAFERPFLPGGGPPTPTQDPNFVSAAKLWSQCMRQKGFHYATPVEASSSQVWASSKTATAQEISTAKADISCKASTRLMNTLVALQNAYDAQYIDRNVTALRAIDAQVR